MRIRFIAAAALAAFASVAQAQEWKEWRGPGRDGSIPSTLIPAQWPAGVTAAWRVELGEGYASPVVSAGRAFIHSRQDPDEIVTAVELSTGKIVWQKKYPAEFKKNQYATQMAKGPNSTPLVSGSRLYTLGATGVLSAWNTADGSLAWRQDYSATIDTSNLFCGTAMSPMLEGGSLIVQVGSDVHGGRVLAIDPSSGKERWAWKGKGPGYASPLAVTIDGVRQIITMTDESIVGIDAGGGASLWSIPFPDDWHENIVTPIWTGQLLIVSGPRQGTHAYSLSRSGSSWQPRQAWRNADVTMYTSSPVLADGHVYGMSTKRRGQFVALDAATGAVKWATEGRDGGHASILLTKDHLLFLNDSGVLIVAERSAERFKETRRYEIGTSQTWAVPVFLPDGLLIRDAKGAARFKWN